MDVAAELAAIVGDEHVATDPDVVAAHVVDWTGAHRGATPAVVRPGSTEEVAALVRWARRTRTPLVPQGGNTGLVGGSVPQHGEVVVSMRRLDGVTDVDPDAGQLTAGAGATVAAVQRAAAGAGWRYGVDFAARDSATIGGSIATDAGGLRVVRHGSTRRQVLGVEAVLGTGAVVRRLDGLVKDNTGLDLAGLLCGSEGTLGIVTRARLGLVAAAGATVTALVGLDSMAAAVAFVGDARRRLPQLEAAEVILAPGAALAAAHRDVPVPIDAPVLVLVEAVGPPDPTDALAAVVADADAIDAVVATDSVRASSLWALREAHTEAIATTGIPRKYDVTLPASRLARFVDDVPDLVAAVAPAAVVWQFGHVADGNIHVNVVGVDDESEPVVAAAVLGRVVADGGSVSAEHGIGTAKLGWLRRNRGDADVDAMRAIVDALDPDAVCNPAVLFDRLDRTR